MVVGLSKSRAAARNNIQNEEVGVLVHPDGPCRVCPTLCEKINFCGDPLRVDLLRLCRLRCSLYRVIGVTVSLPLSCNLF